MRSALVSFGLLLAVALAAGCGNDRSCEIDADCFSGEYCSSEVCVVGTRPTNAEPNNEAPDQGTSGPDATMNNADPDMGTGRDDAGQPASCQVDLFGNACTEDGFEENDLYQQDLPIPIAQDSWCEGDMLVSPSQSFEGTLCPGDQADLFRFLIDNRTPNECLADSLTIRVTVEFDVPCDATEQVRTFAYRSYQNPNSNSSCGQDEDVRCTVSDDQRTHTFEWVREAEALFDHRLIIEPREDDVQVDYIVTVDIVQ